MRGRKKQNKKTKETTKKEEKQREHRGKPANKQTDGRDGEQTDRRTGGRADKRTEAEARQQPTHADTYLYIYMATGTRGTRRFLIVL